MAASGGDWFCVRFDEKGVRSESQLETLGVDIALRCNSVIWTRRCLLVLVCRARCQRISHLSLVPRGNYVVTMAKVGIDRSWESDSSKQEASRSHIMYCNL